MVYIRSWVTYLPSGRVEVEGKKLPAPAHDEDEITMSYEVLSRLDIPNGTHLVFVKDGIERNVDFHIVADLLEAPTSTVSVFSSLDDAIEHSIDVMPSILVVVRTDPPAGSVAIEFGKRGIIEILKHEVRKEFMGFIRTSLTDERALSDLLSEITLTNIPKVVKKLIHARGSRHKDIKIVSGYMNKPKILEKTIASLKLKNADTSPALEIVKQGFKGNFAAVLSLIKGLEKCRNSDKMLFIGEASSGGVYVLIMKCKKR